ncbi:MAG: hypothetical protein ABI333_14590 [bacterium]
MKTTAAYRRGLRLTFALCLFVSAGCGGRTIGGGPSDGGLDPTDGTSPDGNILLYDTFGQVWLSLWQESDPANYNAGVNLVAAFFGEDYDPIFTMPGHLTTENTPDGVTCDIYMRSGMLDPPEPDPPPQRDGGRISAWAGFDPGRLETVWIGSEYDVDYRWVDSPDWPAWIDSGAVAIQFEGEGSAYVDAFRTEVTLATVPEILAPPAADVPVPPDDEGNFLVSWASSPGLADETLVTFEFNMDWDDSVFRCHPPVGYDHFLLPSDWVAEWSWGGGYMSVTHLNSEVLEMGESRVTIRTLRTRRQFVSFGIYED